MSSELPIAIDYSPRTQLQSGLGGDTTDTVAELKNIAAVPALESGQWGSITFSTTARFDSEDPADYETCYFNEVDAGTGEIKGMIRGVAGTRQAWPADTYCRCTLPAKAWNEVVVRLMTLHGIISVNNQLVREVV